MANDKRLIDANATLKKMQNWNTKERLINCVEDAPTVDAAPVVHGHWEHMGEADYKCSLCGFRFTSGDPISMFPYCRCGAKMDGEHNVDRGIPKSSLCDSGMRHLAKYLDGWTDENHLVAAAWNFLWAIEMVKKRPECVNTPWGADDEQT